MEKVIEQLAKVELRENDVWCKKGSHMVRPEAATSEEVVTTDKFGTTKLLRFTCLNCK